MRLDDLSEHEEPDHVPEQVHEIRMEELARDHPPELEMINRGVNREIAPILQPAEPDEIAGTHRDFIRWQHPVEEEDGDVEDDQPRGGRPHLEMAEAASRLAISVIVAVVNAHWSTSVGRRRG